ncbi:MAG TPA: hypothetical protein VMD27_02865 [Candidatus Aquilonibacter sp.]|nr:hypothetical protein [Candidatus Aquilonibacter sp.]
MLADIGIPMIFIQWPLMICALIPVIVVEALLIRRWVPLSFRDAFIGTTKANLVSTFAGFPLAWLAMFAIEMGIMLPLGLAAEKWHWQHLFESPFFEVVSFFIGMAWLAPSDQAAYWLVPLAAGLLLIPSFYVSVWLERFICRRAWPSSDAAAVRLGVFRANLASYVVLFILACGWAGVEFYIHRP